MNCIGDCPNLEYKDSFIPVHSHYLSLVHRQKAAEFRRSGFFAYVKSVHDKEKEKARELRNVISLSERSLYDRSR